MIRNGRDTESITTIIDPNTKIQHPSTTKIKFAYDNSKLERLQIHKSTKQ